MEGTDRREGLASSLERGTPLARETSKGLSKKRGCLKIKEGGEIFRQRETPLRGKGG